MDTSQKVLFSCSNRKINVAQFAIARPGETKIEAVKRSIERTTGTKAFSGRSGHWTEDRNGKVTSETFAITLTERKKVRNGYPVVAEIRVTI